MYLSPEADLHIHTSLCGHARGEPEEYLERAAELGLRRVCFTDHVPLPGGFDPRHRMSLQQLDDYVKMVGNAAKRWEGRLEVLLGLECDYLPGLEEYYEQLSRRYPWDFFLGSVHFLGHFGSDKLRFLFARDPGYRPEEVEETYWHQMAAMVDSRLFQVVAHFDLFKRREWSPRPYAKTIKKILAKMADTQTVLEINPSGLDREHTAAAYPHPEILQWARKAGVEICYGSDAHAPEQVGRHGKKMAELAAAAGYHSLVWLQRGKIKKFNISIDTVP